MSRGPGKRTAAGDALSTLAVRVFQLNGALLKAGDALTAPSGQSSARWQLLAAAEGDMRSVAQIARALSLTRQSVQRVADLLERDGLVRYLPNPAHARANIVGLTSAGRSVLGKIQNAQRGWADALAGEIGERELQQAATVVGQLVDALRRSDGS